MVRLSLKRLFREPLVHFVVLGAIAFCLNTPSAGHEGDVLLK